MGLNLYLAIITAGSQGITSLLIKQLWENSYDW